VDAVQRRVLALARKSEAHTLAASMHSSMRRWASLRTSGTICAILPLSSKIMRVSVVSKSIAPRFARAFSSTRKSWSRFSRWGSSAESSARTAGSCSYSAAATLV
jgi:hypothetical protein